MVDSLHLGTIIKDTGDVGRFQIILLIFLELCLLSHSWSVLFMAFGAAVPSYTCNDNVNASRSLNNVTDHCFSDGVKCSDWTFSSTMRTVVSDVSTRLM